MNTGRPSHKGGATAAPAAAAVVAALLAAPAPAVDWVVDSTGDGPDVAVGDDACDDGSGSCTLRAAIMECNFSPTPDRVLFAIAGAGVHVIRLTDSLPDHDDHQGILIDGTSQPGYAGAPLIELDGSDVPGHGLRLLLGHAEIVALSIHSFGSHGLVIDGGHYNFVRRSFIGLDAAGGTRGNGGHGVFVSASVLNIIGGPLPGEGNVIAANLGDGVHLARSGQNQVLGNLIGTDAAGQALGNLGAGVRVFESSDNFIGTPEAGNTVAANAAAGIALSGSGAARNRMQRNLIGADPSGLLALANRSGVLIDGGSDNIVGPGNVIAGNDSSGVRLDGAATGNAVVGNLIGLAADAVTPLGNGGDGVLVEGVSDANRIGGDTVEDGNRIGGNAGAGVVVAAGRHVRIGFNAIDGNGGLGIDLGGDGAPDPNDPLDPDTGANDRLNAPAVTAASSDCTGLDLAASLATAADVAVEIAFFASAACDPSGFGEGARPLGLVSGVTDPAGRLDVAVTVPAIVSGGAVLTATATDGDGNTSEFSPCLVVAGPACPPGCGDGVVDAGEECDTSGIPTATCDPDCTRAACGDGVLNPAAGEECDDDNTTAGDGCSPTCQIESCITAALQPVAGLTAVGNPIGSITFRWQASPDAAEYHLNAVSTKLDLSRPWRAPRGAGVLRCFAPSSRTECTEPPSAGDLVYYQVLAACGVTGDLEGPP